MFTISLFFGRVKTDSSLLRSRVAGRREGVDAITDVLLDLVI